MAAQIKDKGNNSDALILSQDAAFISTGADDAFKSALLNHKGIIDESMRPYFIPPDGQVFIDEHWLSSDIRGTIGWMSGAVAPATAGVIATVLDDDHPGVIGLSTQGSATGRTGVYSADGNRAGCGTFLTGTTLRMRWVVQVTNLATLGAEEFFVKVGMSNLVSSAVETGVNGVVFSYKLSNSPNWEIIATRAGSTTRITTTTPVDTNWMILEMNYDGSNATFYFNGVQAINSSGLSAVSIASSLLPTKTTPLGLHARIVKTVGTSNRNLYVDRCSFICR